MPVATVASVLEPDVQGEATAPDFSLLLLVAAFGWLDQQREQSLQLRSVLEPDAQGEATAPGFLVGCRRYCW
ncbi:hypothetical protein PR002_g4575 [Phytophthora rubi]|uniref:Uncharacterized protein n=1 Tax=Phytophthora rubi TaxID=129364 RepID=A0A6A3NC58_9STRA|nr:hypothetical protein PR002_g4575 [Phytophthora rubi]